MTDMLMDRSMNLIHKMSMIDILTDKYEDLAREIVHDGHVHGQI